MGVESYHFQMNIENVADLKVLVHTAREGSLTAAAALLGITPAAASAALKRLEGQVAARLFVRSTRAMRLTDEGQTLLDYAARALDLLAEAQAQLSEARHELVGTLRLAAPSDLTRTVLLPWLNDFQRAHPGVQLALSVGDQPLDLMRDEVDLALRYGALTDSRLVARLLYSAPRLVCASPAYLARRGLPSHPQDLAQHNCLVFHRAGRPFRDWQFQREAQRVSVRVQGDRLVDDASLVTAWALAGEGVLLRSEPELRQCLRRGELQALLPDWQADPYPLHALLPSGRFVPARVRALVDFLAQRFAEMAQL